MNNLGKQIHNSQFFLLTLVQKSSAHLSRFPASAGMNRDSVLLFCSLTKAIGSEQRIVFYNSKVLRTCRAVCCAVLRQIFYKVLLLPIVTCCPKNEMDG